MENELGYIRHWIITMALVLCFSFAGCSTVHDFEGTMGHHTADSLAAARQKFIDSRDKMAKSLDATGKVTETLDSTLTTHNDAPITLRTQIKDVLEASTQLSDNLQQFSTRTARLDEECSATKVNLQEHEQATTDRNIKTTEQAIDAAVMKGCVDAVAEARKFIDSLGSSLRFASDLAQLSEVLDAVAPLNEGTDTLRKTLSALRGQAAQYSSKLSSLRRNLDNLPTNGAIVSEAPSE